MANLGQYVNTGIKTVLSLKEAGRAEDLHPAAVAQAEANVESTKASTEYTSANTEKTKIQNKKAQQVLKEFKNNAEYREAAERVQGKMTGKLEQVIDKKPELIIGAIVAEKQKIIDDQAYERQEKVYDIGMAGLTPVVSGFDKGAPVGEINTGMQEFLKNYTEQTGKDWGEENNVDLSKGVTEENMPKIRARLNYITGANGWVKKRMEEELKQGLIDDKQQTVTQTLGTDLGIKGEGANDHYSVKKDGKGNVTGITSLSKNTVDDAAESDGRLTEGAISIGAEEYLATGRMPSLGRGADAAWNRAQIMNIAEEKRSARGITTPDVALNRLRIKANMSARVQLEKQRAQVAAFERTANMNADLALEMSDNVSRTGVPLFTAWVNAGRTHITGDPDVSRFNASVETFANEYAKIMSGSMGNTPVSDALRSHTHEMINKAMNKDQFSGTINLLKREMDNRMVGFDTELAELDTQMASAIEGVTGGGVAYTKETPYEPKSKEDMIKNTAIGDWFIHPTTGQPVERTK